MAQKTGEAIHIFLTYLKLGCVSFGGPVAHLGYFREAFVVRRKWLSESEYAGFIALCQSVPGPSSSQLGFCIGWVRGGLLGAIAAWIGFTLPSAALMVAAAYGLVALGESALAYTHGLLAAAVAVVAKAILGMATSLCPDFPRSLLAIGAASMALLLPGSFSQLLAVAFGAAAGIALYRRHETAAPRTTDPPALGNPESFCPRCSCLRGCLAAATFIPSDAPVALLAKHYHAGALVFGGGHVVLPLLNESVVATGLVEEPTFLAGYGIAQALPGPLFTIAAFTGTAASGSWVGGLASLAAIFLPGMLLVAALMPVWRQYQRYATARAALTGANAAVVGLLIAAFVTPVWSEGVRSAADLLLAGAAFLALHKFKLPTWAVIIGCGVVGFLLTN